MILKTKAVYESLTFKFEYPLIMRALILIAKAQSNNNLALIHSDLMNCGLLREHIPRTYSAKLVL